LLAFGLGVVSLASARPSWRWEKAFLRAAVYFGAYAVVGTELLSLIHALTRPGLVLLWLVPIGPLATWLLRQARQGAALRLPSIPLSWSGPEWVLLLILAIFLSVTGLVAYLSPPNTWDSLTYHMARVAHWAQAGSLNHYASGIERQNLMPPGAEIGMLHAYVLAAGDRLVNFPQWLAMVASLIGAAAIARLLGAPRVGQLAAAVFVATLPMGIAQATSTMTDYVVAIWVICVAFETTVIVIEGSHGPRAIVPLALAAGLAVLAKPTAFAYLAPFALVAAIVILRRRGAVGLLRSSAVAAALILTVNGGYFGRNLVTYGNALGSSGTLENHRNAIFNWKVVASNLIRNASLHAGTPWEPVNEVVFRGLVWSHLKLGMRLADPRTSVHGFQLARHEPNEDRSGNPVHAVVAVVALVLIGVATVRGDRAARLPMLGLLLAAASFLTLSSMIKFTTFGSRYHLPFFVLIASPIGYLAGRWRSSWIAAGLAVALALTSSSWLLRLGQRPLLEDQKGLSVVTSPRDSMYFTTGRALENPYRQIVDRIENAHCTSVGIALGGDAAEYPLWPFLGAPRPDLDVEWIVAGTPSARYANPDFVPCAVICDSSCPQEWTSVRNLPLDRDFLGFRLFMRP